MTTSPTPGVPAALMLAISQPLNAFLAEAFTDAAVAKLKISVEVNGKAYEHNMDAAALKLQPALKKFMETCEKMERRGKTMRSARSKGDKPEKVSSSRRLKEDNKGTLPKPELAKANSHSLPKVEIVNSSIGSPNSTMVFGVPLGTLMRRQVNSAPGESIPIFIRDVLKYIHDNGTEAEGIFRLSAAKSQIDALKDSINKGERTSTVVATVTPIVAADLLGAFFRELPSPLIPSEFFEACLQATTLNPQEAIAKRLRDVLFELPEPNKTILKELLQLFSLIQGKSAVNKMGASNIAVAFGPNILYKPESEIDASDLVTYQNNVLRCNTVVRVMIEDYNIVMGGIESPPPATVMLPVPAQAPGTPNSASVQLVTTLSKHQYPIQYLTVAGNHREVWSADASGSIKVWDAEKNMLIREVETRQENIFSLLLDEDRLWIASAQSLQVWHQFSGELLAEVSAEPTYSLLKVGRSIWTGGSGNIHIYDAKSLVYQTTLPQQGLFMALALVDGCVWGGTVEQTIFIFTPQPPYELLAEINDAHGAKISSIIGVADTVWTAADDNLIRVWSPKSWELLQNIEVEAGVCDITSFGNEVWACCFDSVIRIFNAKTYQCVQELAGHHSDVVVSVVPVSVDTKWFAWSCSTDQILNVFSVRNCTLRRPIRPAQTGTGTGRGRGTPINRNSKMLVVKDRKKTADWASAGES